MDEQTRHIILFGLIVGPSFLVSLSFTGLEKSLVITLVAAAISGVVYYLWKIGYLKRIRSNALNSDGGLFNNQKDLNALWEDIQDWESDDPRKTELIWDPVTTSVKYSAPNPKQDFMFISIVSRYKVENVEQLGFRLHIVIESSSGFIVQHSSVKYREELYDNPFDNVPIVQDLKRGLISGEEVVNRLRSSSVGRLPGGYTAFDSSSVVAEEGVEVESE